MSDEWVKELKTMKEKTEIKLKEAQTKEEKLQEKYEGEDIKILDMIRTLCEPIVDLYKSPSEIKTDQPKLIVNEGVKSAMLEMPVLIGSTNIDLSVSFRLTLTNQGYSAEVKKQNYDVLDERGFVTFNTLFPPITEEEIQNEIRTFLKDRNYTKERLDEKRRLSGRDYY